MQLTDFRSLPDALSAQIQARPKQIALCFIGAGGETKEITYARLGEDIRRAAGLLRQRQMQPGELAILIFQHSYELAVAFFAAMTCGVVPTVFSYLPSHSAPTAYQKRLAVLIQQTGAKHVLTTVPLQDNLASIVGTLPCQITTIDDHTLPDTESVPLAPIGVVSETAYIQFSSGTTGLPQGVVISHCAALNNLAALAKGFPFGQESINVGWLPFFHDMGLVTQLLLPLIMGGLSVTIPPDLWLRRPITLLRAIHTYRGTMSWMPNFAFAHSVRHIREQDLVGLELNSWQTLGCGGESVQIEIVQHFVKRFAPFGLDAKALMVGYGMAENVLGVSHSSFQEGLQPDWIARTPLRTDSVAITVAPDDHDAQAVVSCGIPFDGTEITILDEDANRLGERQVGEIGVRGNSLFSAYYQQTEATAVSRKDGWFRTGDIGYLADGQLYLLDRKKDLIISGGKNISPHTIEAIAQTVLGQQLHRSAAFGLRDDSLGTEVPVLVCELRKQLDEATQKHYAGQIKQQVREAADLILADLRFVSRGLIEVTTSGKIARAATKQNYQQAGFVPTIAALFTEEDPATMDSTAWETTLLSLCSAMTATAALDPQRSFTELGLDSLALMRLLLLVEEKSGYAVPIERLARQPTIAHLARLLSQPSAAVAEPACIPSNDRYAIPQPPSKRWSRANHRQWLHHHLLHRGPQVRGHALPYGLGTHLLQQITRSSPWRDTVFGNEVELIRRSLNEVDLIGDPALAIQQSLMVNTWPLWRQQALAKPSLFQQWVTIRGAAILAKASAQGRGAVIAFPHTQLRRLLLQIDSFRQRELAIIGNLGPKSLVDAGLPDLALAMAQGGPLSKVAVRAGQLHHAQQVLTRGGLAIVLADDTEGEGGIQAPFHGRMRPFRPGIAELALQSGAAIVPTFATMQVNGQITFEFLEPLTLSPGNHNDQVADLLQQYALLLAAHWQRNLDSMEWFVLRNFFAFPTL